MTKWTPKNIDDALKDAIASAINDNTKSEDVPGAPEYLLDGDFDEVVEQAIKNIKNIKGLKMIWREDE